MMERKKINCYSVWANRLRLASYAILIGGVIAYIAIVYAESAVLGKFSFLFLLTALPVLLGSVFSSLVGFCISDMTQNSEQKAVYLHFKAKENGIDFDYDS